MLQLKKSYLIPILGSLSVLLFMVILYRTAWLSDDAFITYRCVGNWLNGQGLTFNVGQRVQAFTHPLWALLHIPIMALSEDIYPTALGLSMITSLAAFLMLLRLFIRQAMAIAFLTIGMLSSAAMMDYSTSGLENPLTNLLIAIFIGLWLDKEPKHRLLWLAFLGGLIALNRMDAILLIVPALLVAWWPVRSWKHAGLVILGFLPFILWEIWATFYYGFPFPTTAYAKLNTGLPLGEQLLQGFQYYGYTLVHDPLSLLVILGGLSLPFILKKRKLQPLAGGLLLYCLYTWWIGGDFMGGRFFNTPFFISIFLIARVLSSSKIRILLMPAMVLLSIFFWGSPWRSHADLGIHEKGETAFIGKRGVANERAFYFQATGRIAAKGRKMPVHKHIELGKKLSGYTNAIYFTNHLGFIGFYGGPNIFLIDSYALNDPFLAQLPAVYRPDWRPGHIERVIPRAYIESFEKEKNLIQDTALARMWDALDLITTAPLWDKRRLRMLAKWHLNPGDLKNFDKDYYRLPIAHHLEASAWRQPELNIPTLYSDAGISLEIPNDRPVRSIKLIGQNNCEYVCVFRQGEEILSGKILTKTSDDQNFSRFSIPLPQEPVSNVVFYPKKVKGSCTIKSLKLLE
jgi:arabinofuranosyltransferase